MATSTTVTRHKGRQSPRTAFDAQPIPTWNARSARQGKRINLSDADVAVRWLNAAKGAKPTGSYERVVSILQTLQKFRQMRADIQKWISAGAVSFPPDRTDPPTWKQLCRRADALHSGLNRALLRYAFRPRVTYFVFPDAWWGGMVPNPNSRWFQIKLDPSFRAESRTISEADAVLSLVRLDLVGDIGKVCRCQMCQDRWRVAAKSSYRFCSAKCREEFYKRLPDYHSRKAANQRAFRKRLKQIRVEWR